MEDLKFKFFELINKQKLPDILDGQLIKDDLSRLETQQRVVSKQVLKLILDKTTACEEEFERIVGIKQLLGETVNAVRRARQDLGLAHEHFTTASLGILANYRKRTLVQDLLRSLNTIKTLERTEARLQELLTEGDFPGAISLLLECQGAATTYRHFSCVAALSGKLQDTLVMAEEQLDVALAKMCYVFEEDVYSKLQAAYALLGKTRIAMDQLHMHFTTAIHNSAFTVIHSYAQQDNSTKKQYSDLCKCVQEVDLIPCLVSLCQALWRIVLSYHQISNWHLSNYSSASVSSNADGDFESNFNEPYVKQKLKNGLDRLWHDVQTRVSSLVLAANLIHFKVDDFLQVLAVLYRLEQIGKEFTGKESEDLQNSVKKQSIVYFRRYHAARLDELRIFLENEVWTVCPVQADFTLLHLQEFKGLRNSVQQCAGIGSHSSAGSLDGSSVGGGYFSRYSFSNTPFDSTLDTTDPSSENILNDLADDPSGYFSEDSDEEGPELRGDVPSSSSGFNRSTKRCSSHTCPLLTNTALTVLRHCGKYLQMSRLLRFIAADVIFCLCQLFEYYLFSVHSFFTADLPDYPIDIPSSIKLQAVLKRIRDNLIQNSAELDDTDHNKVPPASISPEVDLNNVETLYGLPVRVVAVESLVFLADQFNFLRAYLEQLLDSSKHILSIFYTETISVAVKVRYPVYSCVSWRSVNTQQALVLMGRVNWEINDVMSQHSPYVDTLFRELQIFSMRLNEIEEHVHLNQHVLENLWENIVHLLSFILVEGFSLSKRCSNGGRALMQLDFTQLFSQVEKLCSLRPLPYRELVDTYVKAYYLTEPALETFIKEHKEYSTKQLVALISCVCQGNKKSKQRLCTMLEEWEKLGMR
ncbi:vacuolar protein sorting 50 isoform X2 [Lycorma delicatula]|uniref:vacuolar protein sorting 50 isoform X2 n=1 Tax=Lycorma delicatula TaxID=130591 RepID=UPI003F51043B